MCHGLSAGEPQEFGRRSFRSRAIGDVCPTAAMRCALSIVKTLMVSFSFLKKEKGILHVEN